MITTNYTHDEDGTLVIPGNLKKLPKIATYDGNPKILKANVKIAYEPWQLEEIAKCATDINYFVSNYAFIIDPDEGKTLIKLYDIQHDFLNHLNDNRFSVVLAPRQCGKSTCTSLYILHYILYNEQKKALILANKEKIAKEIFQKVRVAYENLPYWLQVGVEEWQKTMCTLANGSSASAEATTAEGMRGLTGNLIMLDEFAFIQRNIAEEFFTSMYPVISKSKKSKLVVVSTPNGLNHYYNIWNKAEKKQNFFKPFRIYWKDIPGYDEEWKEETIANTSPRQFTQEFECDFLGSSATLIETSILSSIEALDPIELDLDNHLYVFEKPKRDHTYVMGNDTAKGTGGDYSVANIIDITTYPFKQVAIYRNNLITTRKFGDVIEKLGYMYNEAFLMVENNDIGHAVTDYLWHDLEYENLINFGGNKKELGVRSTKKSKAVALDLLKEYIEDGKLEIRDINTLYELSRFVEARPGIFRAEDGENDDCVTSLMWGLYIVKTQYVDKNDIEYEDKGDSPKEENDNIEMPPMPILNDGFDDGDGVSLDYELPENFEPFSDTY